MREAYALLARTRSVRTRGRPGPGPQHRLVVAQVVRHVATYIVADGIGIPFGSPQQVLHAVRSGVPGSLGDRFSSCGAVVEGMRPSISRRAWRRGSTRLERPANRLMRPAEAGA
ncbi:hypothetical protein B6R96_19180 [Streptomyces sp. Sge12]|nr:hypothetical protein B6R96_19180 [Streptomyces sp. Sge12]